jgi:hypothetical protein
MFKKNKEKELVYLGPKIEDFQIIIRPTEEQLEIGTIHKIEDGKDITGYDLISLEPQEDGHGYYMERIYEVSVKGPVKVSSKAYKFGWDRTFGSN